MLGYAGNKETPSVTKATSRRAVLWNPAGETFIDDAEANAMLARPMRSPYTLREMT
jgi:hypothetical protein